jgi:hypothetical protein
VYVSGPELEALLAAYRAEFLHECVTQGMTAAEAAECLNAFEDDVVNEFVTSDPLAAH